MRRSLFAAALLYALNAGAQTETLVAGGVADSSILAPVAVWTRVDRDGNTLSVALNGWLASATSERRIAPRTRLVTSLGATPLRARSSDHAYVGGERRDDLTFDDASYELSVGRIDWIGERYISDVRGVVLYDSIRGLEAVEQSRWAHPYAGVRTRQIWRHITAENPMLMTFEGSEVAGDAELFAGSRSWSRFAFSGRAARRRGPLRAAVSGSLFAGNAIDRVNAFLAGASWPMEGLPPMYGFRYAEFRLPRGGMATADLQYAATPALWFAVHESVLRAPAVSASGAAVDVTINIRGAGVRAGVAFPSLHNAVRREPVIYASILGASFISRPVHHSAAGE